MNDEAPPGASWNEHGPWSGGGPRRPAGRGGGGIDALASQVRRLIGGGPPAGIGWRWVVAAVAGVWLLFTTAHTIGPQQRGVVTRLGRYVGTLEPGLRLTLPAPIDIVRKIDVDHIHEIAIDGPGDATDPPTASAAPNLMLTGDENLVDLAYSVRWSIRDPALYLFALADPKGTIREVAESAMREQIARASLAGAMGPERARIEASVAERMQAILDSYRAGIQVQGVAIRQADPPAEVTDAFKEVSAAQQQAQSYLNQARTYATQVAAKASGESAAFDQVYAQYRLAPDVTRRRMYYETMEKVLAKTDKVIVQAPGVTPYLPIQPNKPSVK